MHLGIRRFLALLGIVAVLGAVAVAILLPGWRDHLKEFSEREIDQALKAVMGSHVQFDRQLAFDVRAERSQKISFKDLVVRPREGDEPILSAEEVIIELDPWTVVKMATPAVLRVTFRRPRITIRRDEDGVLNFVTLVESVREYRRSLTQDATQSREPPIINIEDGTIEIVDARYLEEPIVLEKMNLEIGGGAGLDELEGSGELAISGFSADGKWKFGGEIALAGERAGLENVWLTGTFISLDDEWEGRLHGAVGELWSGLEPRGVLREIKLHLTEHDGELLITSELDASELEFGLLEETIGEKVHDFTAEVTVGDGGTVVKARAKGKPPEIPGGPARGNQTSTVPDAPKVLFDLEGRFGSASHHSDHDSLGLSITDLQVDRQLRQSLTKLMKISRGLRGESGGDAERDLDKIWGEKIARSIFDRHEPRGLLSLDSELRLPRGIEGDLQFSGEVSIREGSLVVPVGLNADGSHLDVDLEDLEGTFTFVGDTIRVKQGTRVKGTVAGSEISFAGHVTNALESQSSTWLADFRAKDLRLDATMLEGMSSDDENSPHASWLRILRDYEVKGVANISVKLMGGSGGVPYRSIRILPAGGMSFAHPAFPYPIEDIDGFLEISGEQVDFNLSGFQPAAEAGGEARRGAISMKGDIARMGRPTERSEVTIDASGLRVDPEVLAALARVKPELGDILSHDLHARGFIDVALKRTTGPDPALGHRVVVTNMNVDLVDCHADWAGAAASEDGTGGYRYRLVDLKGQVRVRGDVVTIDNVRGTSVDGEAFYFNGEMTCPATGPSTAGLTVTAPSLEFSDNLRLLLSTVDNDYVSLWHDFSPTGTISLEYVMELVAGDLERSTIRIEPQGCTARAVHFPMPVSNISSGSVTIVDGHVKIDQLTSIDEVTGATITIDGEIGKGAEAVRLDVTATELPFNEELYGAVPQSVKEIWDLFELSGTSNVSATLRRAAGGADGDLDIEVGANLRGVTVTYRARPVPLENVSGLLSYSNKERDHDGERIQRIQFAELRADLLGGSLAVADGTIQGAGPDRHASIKIIGDGLQLKHEDLHRLDPHVQELLAGLNASGTVGVDAILVLEGDDIDGLSAQGMLTASKLRVRDLLIDDISANVFLKDRILELSEVRGSVYEGRLDAEFTVDTSAFAAFRGTLDINGVDVKPFVTDVFGMADTTLVRGRLAASLEFEGLGPARENLVGVGEITIRDGWLWQMPFFLQILDSVPIAEERLQDERGFRACAASFRVADGMVRFDQIHVDAHTLRVGGHGDMDFDGALDMLVAVSPTPANKIPVFSDLLSGVATSLIGFAVKGTYREPKLEVQPAKVFTDILASITDAMGADIESKESELAPRE